MLKFNPFGGLVPRTGSRLLPDTGALRAVNIKLQSGELRPLHDTSVSYVPLSPKTLPPLSIFRARTGTSSDAWFSWPIDVDCVRVPLSTDVESRFCWTGDGAPKTAKYSNAVSGGGNNYPLLANELTLGIPNPTTACTVTPSGGIGAATTRYYCYTFESQDGEESGPSPTSATTTGKVDDTWAIAAMNTAPLNTGSITSAAKETPAGYIELTVSAAHWLRVGDSVVISGIASGVTDANGTWTVQTTTSSTKFTILKTTSQTGGTTGTWTRSTAWNTTSMTKNLYRTVGTTGNFQLVASGIAVATTTYNDTILDALIPGDDLISIGWEPPPVGLAGLCVHSSGALVGFVNNLLCFSEPFQPHAWPTAYQLGAGFTGVGVATFGSSVVMATAGTPFVAGGVEPATMSGENMQGVYPCLSKRSVIGYGGGMLYASKYGLVFVSGQGVSILTDQFYTRDEWEGLNPDTMVCETADGRIYVKYVTDAGVKELLIIDGPVLTQSSISADELYTDPATGVFYITTSSGILLWDDPDAIILSGNWRSKEVVFPAPVNLGAAKIDFDLVVEPAQQDAVNAINAANVILNDAMASASPPTVNGSINASMINETEINGSDFIKMIDTALSNEVTFNLYHGDTLVASRVVSSTRAFRLPAGYKYDNFSVEVLSQCNIKEIRVAETMDGLRAA